MDLSMNSYQSFNGMEYETKIHALIFQHFSQLGIFQYLKII